MIACRSVRERAPVDGVVTVRTATAADASGIARVYVDTSRVTYRGLVPPAAMQRLSFPERVHCWRSILEEPAHGTLAWVAVDLAGAVVGFAAAGHAREPDAGCDGELYTIYVLPDHHGHGIGTQLFRAVANSLRGHGYGSLMAWVLAGNPSRGFFETLGGRRAAMAYLRPAGVRLTKMAYTWDLESPPGTRLT